MNKTIQFNSDFLSIVSKKKPSNGTRKKERNVVSDDKNNSKVLRQKLLERIKEYQNKTTCQKNESASNNNTNANTMRSSGEKKEIDETDNTFANSLEILNGLSSSSSATNARHNKTVKHKPISSDVSLEMPDCFKEDTIHTDKNVNHPTDKNVNHPTINRDDDNDDMPPTPPIVIKDQPKYSSIKNGSKPTYKEAMMLKPETKSETETEPIEELVNPGNITHPNEPSTSTIASQSQPNSLIKDNGPRLQSRKKMISKTYKYTLGKNGRNVSVLLKDMKTRKMVKKECSQLTHTPIHDIKQYLRKKNLLKIGSNATDDVIKKIYEQAILTGEVRNMSKETLIHNFLKN